MRKIYCTVETKICSLENLDIQSETYGSLLIPVLFLKLSSELSLIINQQFDKKTVGMLDLFQNVWNSKLLRLKRHIILQKNLYVNSDLLLSASPPHTSSEKNRKASQCVFCDKTNHKSQFCKTVTVSLKERKL